MGKTLIFGGAVLTKTGWENPGYVLIDGDKIIELGSGRKPNNESDFDEVIDASNKAVLPGLINAHTHLSQTFMRGLGGGRPLIKWLKERIWPLQGVLDPDALYHASLLGLVENIRVGVIHVVNHHKVPYSYEHTDMVCRAALETGVRLTLARGWVDRGTNAEKPDEIIIDLKRLFRDWHEKQGLIRVANGPLATWRCSDETLKITHQIAIENGSHSHIHISETKDEVEMSLNDTGLRPVNWLSSLGVLDSRMQLVHGVWFDDDEIDLVAEKDAPVIHCPISNSVLGSGIAPISEMLSKKIALRLGTDGPASGDNQDLWESIKAALLFSRVSNLDPTVISPDEVLQAALIEPYLKTNTSADMIIVNLHHSRAVPVHDVVSALVLCNNGSDVDTVIVGGRILMKENKLLVINEDKLYDDCKGIVATMRENAGLDN